MKYRLVFIVVAIASLLTACDDNASNEAVQTPQGNAEQVAQQPTRYRSVSHEEYSASDLDMQRLIDLMDGAVNALV